jgi:hypothetical protein
VSVIFKLVPLALAAILAIALPTVRPTAKSAPDVLTQHNLIYSSEIGAWDTNGGPAVTSKRIMSQVTAARIAMIRYSVYDCFTNEKCGRNHHRGSLSARAYESAVAGITHKDHSALWLKMVPISAGDIGGVTGSIFCPAAGHWAMNVPMEKQLLADTARVYRGPIVLESDNEAEYDCASYWGFSSAGDRGVSTDLGDLYAATIPRLAEYARSLGFSDVVTDGYIGVNGGPGWGESCRPKTSAPFHYQCAIPSQFVDEFNQAAMAAYRASGRNRAYIPEAESVHSYCHSTDFTSSPGYSFSNDECLAWQREWLTSARRQVDRIWGKAIGSQIRFAVSEWSGGTYNSATDRWTGYADGGMASYVTQYLAMLKGDGRTTGTGTAYWEASLFELAGNPQGNGYNVISPNGAPSGYYGAFKRASVHGQS